MLSSFVSVCLITDFHFACPLIVLSLGLQSLLMVFAHLMNLQLEPVLDFLTSVPGPTGKPALEFVLDEWCSRQNLFYGSYERRVRYVQSKAINLVRYIQSYEHSVRYVWSRVMNTESGTLPSVNKYLQRRAINTVRHAQSRA